MLTITGNDPESMVYTDEEHAVWSMLVERQLELLQQRACDEFFKGIELLQLPTDHIPQVSTISQRLQQLSGWSCQSVTGLLTVDEFFALLANKQFPVVTQIRTRKQLDYSETPDIFHELFGHCMMLTEPAYANFLHRYGQVCMRSDDQTKTKLSRLFFYTIEVGLLKTPQGLRIYGGGILSSPKESVFALESTLPERKALTLASVMQQDYQIENVQSRYYYIESFNTLFNLDLEHI